MTNKKQNEVDPEKQVIELKAQVKKLRKEISDLKKPSAATFGGSGWKVSIAGSSVEDRFIRFFRNETIFAGFRNTPARVLITLLSISVLFGYGYYAFLNTSVAIWYLALIILVLLMNAISVRFVFQMEDPSLKHLLDEYHLRRRNKAKERAHDALKSFIGLLITGGLIYGWRDVIFGGKEFGKSFLPDAVFNFTLDSGQQLVLVFFVLGYVSLVKYFSYGLRGEPFISNEEDKQHRNS